MYSPCGYGRSAVADLRSDNRLAVLKSERLLAELYASGTLGSHRLNCELTWIMNRKMGFLGSYLLGLDPSKIPPWGVARSEGVADAAVEAAVTVFVTIDAIEDMIAMRLGCR